MVLASRFQDESKPELVADEQREFETAELAASPLDVVTDVMGESPSGVETELMDEWPSDVGTGEPWDVASGEPFGGSVERDFRRNAGHCDRRGGHVTELQILRFP